MNTVFKSFLWLFFLVSFILLQGCTLPSNQSSNTRGKSVVGQLVIAEPLAINYKSELAIARLSEIIFRAELSDEQRAELLYDRGVLYDNVGLRSLARLDFNYALNLNPTMVDAYNFLGIHYTQLQEFAQAYEKFDSALDLAPQHEYAYFNRGVALYYGGRPTLAAEDLKTFHSDKTNDPYRLLWIYFAEYELDAEQAKVSLKERATKVDNALWAKDIIHLYLGEISQEQFIANLTRNIRSNRKLTDRLCEAYFYLGKYNQMNKNTGAAVNFFKLALSTNVFEFVEHRYARLELDLMRVKVVKEKSNANL